MVLSENNLKNINVKFPLGKFIGVTGVSGSGKSSLVNEILVKGLTKYLSKSQTEKVGKFSSFSGSFNVDKIVAVNQSPIGRTPRSNPATYTSVFDDIRDIFASVEESKTRGYAKGRFSFNVPGDKMWKVFRRWLSKNWNALFTWCLCTLWWVRRQKIQ